MGLSIGRIYEGFFDIVDGVFSRYEDLPTDWPVGSYCKVSQHHINRYYEVMARNDQYFLFSVNKDDFDKRVCIDKKFSFSCADADKFKPEFDGEFYFVINECRNIIWIWQKKDNEWVKLNLSDEELQDWYKSVSGKYNNTETLPSILPDNLIVKITKTVPEAYYVLSDDNVWKETTKLSERWNRLPLYRKYFGYPTVPYHYSLDGERYLSDNKTVDEYMKNHKIFKCDNSDLYIKEDEIIWSGRGVLYDEFINSRGFADSLLTDRGRPADLSKESLEVLKSDGEYFGYDYTYITGTELQTLYESELDKAINEIIARVNKDNASGVNKKLDFIIEHLKDSTEVYKDAYAKLLEKKINSTDADSDEEAEIEDYDEWVVPFDEFISETLAKPEALHRELTKLDFVANLYDIYNESNIRVIYFTA